MPATVEYLRRLYGALTAPCGHGSTEGLRELHLLLTDPRNGCMVDLDPQHPRLQLEHGMGALMCADPDRNHDMERSVREFCRAKSPRGDRVAPMKLFGGPLLLTNGVDARSVPLSPDAAADAMGQILIGQYVGNLQSFSLVYHFPCGFACKAQKTRRDILSAHPVAKRQIRRYWNEADIPQLVDLFGLFHFDFGDGEMAIAYSSKGRIEQWLQDHQGLHSTLLDVI